MTTATDNSVKIKGRRARVSENALRIALKTAKAEGLTVNKLCVMGGHIEIHFGDLEAKQAVENNDHENEHKLEEW